MDAKVKDKSRFSAVTACGGKAFVKTQWLSVPAGREQEAENNPYLETRESPAEKVLENQDAIEEAIEEQLKAEPEVKAEPETKEQSDIDATPEAYDLALEYGVDMSKLDGTGKDGRILKSDVESVVEDMEAKDA